MRWYYQRPSRSLLQSQTQLALTFFRHNTEPSSTPEHSSPQRVSKRGRASNRRRGLRHEGINRGKGALSVLHTEGYRCTRTPESTGPADIWAVKRHAHISGPLARLIQVKSAALFRPSIANDGVFRFLGLGRWHTPWTVAPGITREVWCWVDREGWIARIIINHDNSIHYSGPRGQEVYLSLCNALKRATP